MEKETIVGLLGLVAIFYHLSFIHKETKNNKEFHEADWFDQKVMAFKFGIFSPWNTRFRWGGIVQILLLLLGILLQL